MINKNSAPILFIVGPTASGKSKLAMDIALELDCGGEIVCADSQTIRKGLDIGTAKPSLMDQKTVKHHMLDIIEPYDRFSVAQFKELANLAIADIEKKGKLPIVVGGSGLYIDSILYDFPFRKTKTSLSREKLEAMSVDQLQGLIISKGIALPNNSQNPRHLIRTIESQGQTSTRASLRPGAIVVGLDPGKEALDSRISQRVQKMLSDGFLEEVEALIERYGKPTAGIDAMGYKIALNHRLGPGKFDVGLLIKEFAAADRKYAKRQRSWFKRNKDITWFEQPETAKQFILKQI